MGTQSWLLQSLNAAAAAARSKLDILLGQVMKSAGAGNPRQ